MTNPRLRTLGEAIGVLAVVGSLIFVGLEIRQNAEATRAAAVQGATDAWRDWQTDVGTNRAVWEAIERVHSYEDFSDANYADLQVARSSVGSVIVLLANVHYHYREGLLPADFWEANLQTLEDVFGADDRRGDFYRWRWEETARQFPAPFRALVDSVLAQQIEAGSAP